MSDKRFNTKDMKDFINSENEKNSASGNNNNNNEDILPVNFSVIENYDQSDLLSIEDPDTLVESVNNITDTYKKFGEDFGIDIKYDVHSVSSTFKSILTSSSEEVFKVYLAKAFSKVRLATFNKILISITILVDRITQKEILESDNIELSVGLVEKLMDMMEKINKIYDEVKISSADTVLKQVAKNMEMEKASEEGTSNKLSSEEVTALLSKIRKRKGNNL